VVTPGRGETTGARRRPCAVSPARPAVRRDHGGGQGRKPAGRLFLDVGPQGLAVHTVTPDYTPHNSDFVPPHAANLDDPLTARRCLQRTQQLADLEAASEQERIGVARCVNAIHERGAIVKSLDDGLVDFPAVRQGEEILLCWRLGEAKVTHWHPIDAGYAGRREI